ncbi:hypothetical protein GCM10010266_20440 [Streptomyces griseomycini]|nr:hypothetical protein GCM10010266_20440 [Streptomyces griseomycini]GGR06939.1 hypothetical protein GCM10015536_09810 [Streptomyces griseomycini]
MRVLTARPVAGVVASRGPRRSRQTFGRVNLRASGTTAMTRRVPMGAGVAWTALAEGRARAKDAQVDRGPAGEPRVPGVVATSRLGRCEVFRGPGTDPRPTGSG